MTVAGQGAAGPEPGHDHQDAPGRLLPGQGGRHPERHRRLALPGRRRDPAGPPPQPAASPFTSTSIRRPEGGGSLPPAASPSTCSGASPRSSTAPSASSS
ncbi:MAG: hypothetical protein M0C28_24320 [Candidatus Moduliflexus flocculans]|nr:hypothetical protein [Candidatus Moduliflexus flocculans]